MDLTIQPGETVCLSGPSGSGKSLLLRAIADLIPHEGRVLLDDAACTSMPAHVWRRQVSLLPAESQWWSDRIGDHFSQTEAEDFAALGFDMDVLDWDVSRCSTGEKQRLAILRLLAQQPKALLLDEPTASLDPDGISRAETLIARYRKQHAAPVLWVSHDERQIERMADRWFAISGNTLKERHT